MRDASHCINCHRAIDIPDQKFCPTCGQPTPVHRIDWHFLGHELEHSVLHMDRGILYSLKELMLRPGKLMRDYLEGRRAHQAKPFLLLMATAAAVVFLGKYVLDGGVIGSTLPVGETPALAAGGQAQVLALEIADAWAKVQGWMDRNFAVYTLLLIPLEALAFRLAFVGSGRLNYPEWLVVTAFLTVQTFVFWSLALLVQRWIPQAPALVIGVAICYGLYSLVRLFDGHPRWKIVLRGLCGFGFFLVASNLLVFTLIAALVVSGGV